MAESIQNPRAFPSSAIDDRFGGLSLRDWFAGQALPAIIAAMSAGQHSVDPDHSPEETIAKDAYLLADAMLAQRNIDPGAA